MCTVSTTLRQGSLYGDANALHNREPKVCNIDKEKVLQMKMTSMLVVLAALLCWRVEATPPPMWVATHDTNGTRTDYIT